MDKKTFESRVASALLDNPDYLVSACYEIVDELDANCVGFSAVPWILTSMQLNPGADFGTPGPFVTYCYRYIGMGLEPILKKAVYDAPTGQLLEALAYVERQVDSLESAEIRAIIYKIADDSSLPEGTLDVADHFVQRYEGQ